MLIIFNVLLTLHLGVIISVINQIEAQKFLFHSKFISCLYMFRAPCAHHLEVKIALHSVWYHHTYRWPSRAQAERGLAWNKLIVKQNILRIKSVNYWDKYTEMHGQQNDKYTEMHGQQNDKYAEMHGQQNDKYTEMHGQENYKYTEMHGQQNVKKKLQFFISVESARRFLWLTDR